MSEPVHQAETPQTPSAPMTLAQKLGCLMMIVIALVIALFWWALRNPEERWAESEVAMMTMSWPDQVVAVKTLGEPQRSEAATRLVDAWLRQPDMPRDWHVGANVKITKAVRDRTIQILIENADRSAREAIAKQEAQKARRAAAPKYTAFTPPPVDEHIAKGGEVWARVAPTDRSLDGRGYTQFWLLSADHKKFEALVTIAQADQSKPMSAQSWYWVETIGEGFTDRLGPNGSDQVTKTASMTAASATLTCVVKSGSTGKEGTFKHVSERVATFTFPSNSGALSATGEERSVDTVFLNDAISSGPIRKSMREQFDRITKPNPPRGMGEGK